MHRHGDRTPITPLKNEDYWRSTLPEPHVLDGIARGTNLVRPQKHATLNEDGLSEKKHAATGRGPFGQLTMMGVLQMISLGERLRSELELSSHHHHHDNDETNKFVNNGKLFTPEKPLHPSRIKVMSTDFPRTIQSVQAVLTGLFPANGNRNDDDSRIEADVLSPIAIDLQHTNTYFIPDPQPRQFEEQLALESLLSKRKHLIDRDEELHHIAHRISEALAEHLGEGAHDVSFGIGEEKKDLSASHESSAEEQQQSRRPPPPLAWAQLCEILLCLHSHSLLPPSVSHEDVKTISSHVAWRWFENLSHPVLAKSSMWKFASSLVDTMQRKVQHDSSISTSEDMPAVAAPANEVNERESIEHPLLCIYSAHDSTLIGLLCVFRLEQPAAWPEYGSALKIELIREEGHESNKVQVLQHWVRFSLNGQLLRSTWCTEDNSKPLSMVPLNDLADMIHDEHELFENNEDDSTALKYSWKGGLLRKHSRDNTEV